ncbi:hypothetical protein HDU81_004300 [Chytriomyces hyalinus]|nr:hypothetical protein HDU81_004300 [Chytriomyces hyalinus]
MIALLVPVKISTRTVSPSTTQLEMDKEKDKEKEKDTRREGGAVDRMWGTAHSLQMKLDEFSKHSSKAQMQASPPKGINTNSEAALRLQLLYTMQDILMWGVHTAFSSNSKDDLKALRESLVVNNVDELIWTSVFHRKIEELRASVRTQQQLDPGSQTASKNLLAFLSTATSFYRTLIQNVSICCSKAFRIPTMTSVLYLSISEDSERRLLDSSGPVDEERAKLIQRVLYRSMLYLGDLERYRATYNRSSKTEETWANVHSVYEHAIRIDPNQGKPHCQLAIVATACKQHFNVLYWYCLSMSSSNPPPIAKGNLNLFYKNELRRIPKPDLALDPKRSNLDTLTNAVVHFHGRYLFHPSDSRLVSWTSDTHTEATANQKKICEIFDFFINGSSTEDEAVDDVHSDRDTAAVTQSAIDVVSKTCAIFISAFSELGTMFLEKDKTPIVRQKIRDIQCIILSTLFQIADSCLARLQLHMTRANVTVDSIPDHAALLFAPMGVLCGWLSGHLGESSTTAPSAQENQRNSGNENGLQRGASSAAATDVFILFSKYTTGAGVSDVMKAQYEALPRFCRSLASLSTTLLSFADTDGDSRTLNEDVPLLGFAPLKTFYCSTLEVRGLQSVLDNVRPEPEMSVNASFSDTLFMARASRVLVLARKMSEKKDFDLFAYEDRRSNGSEAGFIVRDEESKRLARIKTAKTLALQLLKTQISTLETTLTRANPASLPTYIPDASIYTSHLNLIKTLLMPSSQCRILVPMDVIHQLDVLKKGNGGIHARAREATRYLEQRFRYQADGVQRLVAQQAGETVKDVSYLEEYKSPEDGVQPPRHLRSFMGSAVYSIQKSRAAEQARVKEMKELGVELVENDGNVWILSEDDEVLEECLRCGVPVKSMDELRKSGFYGRRW